MPASQINSRNLRCTFNSFHSSHHPNSGIFLLVGAGQGKKKKRFVRALYLPLGKSEVIPSNSQSTNQFPPALSILIPPVCSLKRLSFFAYALHLFLDGLCRSTFQKKKKKDKTKRPPSPGIESGFIIKIKLHLHRQDLHSVVLLTTTSTSTSSSNGRWTRDLQK